MLKGVGLSCILAAGHPLALGLGSAAGASREMQAATVLQCAFRLHLARKEATRRRREREAYSEEMEKLQREVGET